MAELAPAIPCGRPCGCGLHCCQCCYLNERLELIFEGEAGEEQEQATGLEAVMTCNVADRFVCLKEIRDSEAMHRV